MVACYRGIIAFTMKVEAMSADKYCEEIDGPYVA
jgi:hypothetical protein